MEWLSLKYWEIELLTKNSILSYYANPIKLTLKVWNLYRPFLKELPKGVLQEKQNGSQKEVKEDNTGQRKESMGKI